MHRAHPDSQGWKVGDELNAEVINSLRYLLAVTVAANSEGDGTVQEPSWIRSPAELAEQRRRTQANSRARTAADRQGAAEARAWFVEFVVPQLNQEGGEDPHG